MNEKKRKKALISGRLFAAEYLRNICGISAGLFAAELLTSLKIRL